MAIVHQYKSCGEYKAETDMGEENVLLVKTIHTPLAGLEKVRVESHIYVLQTQCHSVIRLFHSTEQYIHVHPNNSSTVLPQLS